jgi:hypothetical protein
VGHPDVSSDTAELRAGSVEDIPPGADRAIDIGFEIWQLGKMIDELKQSGKSRLHHR